PTMQRGYLSIIRWVESCIVARDGARFKTAASMAPVAASSATRHYPGRGEKQGELKEKRKDELVNPLRNQDNGFLQQVGEGTPRPGDSPAPDAMHLQPAQGASIIAIVYVCTRMRLIGYNDRLPYGL